MFRPSIWFLSVAILGSTAFANPDQHVDEAQAAKAILDDNTPPARAAAIADALLGKTNPPWTREIASSANTRGYRLYQQGKLDDALPLFLVAAALDPSYGMPRYNVARVLALQADVPGAVKWLQELKAMGRSQRARLAEALKDPAFKKIWDSPESAALQPLDGSAVQLLDPVQYHAGQLKISHPEKQSWVGICEDQDGVWLKPVEISVARTKDDLVDRGSAKTGRTIVVHGCKQPISVVANLPKTAAGRLTTATLKPQTGGDLPRPTELLFGGETYTVDPVEKKIRSKDGVDYFASRVTLRHGTRSSVLFVYDDGDTPPRTITVKWAGDLDGDGSLDVLLSEDSTDDTTTHLYLSGSASGRDLVKEVAVTTYGGD